jgi:glutathione S-transferase
MLFLATELYPLVEIIDYPERFLVSDEAIEPTRTRADELWKERWHVLEANIAGAPYCVASGFSATDLYITKFSAWLESSWRREQLPKVNGLFKAVCARPALQGVWARHIR